MTDQLQRVTELANELKEKQNLETLESLVVATSDPDTNVKRVAYSAIVNYGLHNGDYSVSYMSSQELLDAQMRNQPVTFGQFAYDVCKNMDVIDEDILPLYFVADFKPMRKGWTIPANYKHFAGFTSIHYLAGSSTKDSPYGGLITDCMKRSVHGISRKEIDEMSMMSHVVAISIKGVKEKNDEMVAASSRAASKMKDVVNPFCSELAQAVLTESENYACEIMPSSFNRSADIFMATENFQAVFNMRVASMTGKNGPFEELVTNFIVEKQLFTGEEVSQMSPFDRAIAFIQASAQETKTTVQPS
jgi:hypothetical protein